MTSTGYNLELIVIVAYSRKHGDMTITTAYTLRFRAILTTLHTWLSTSPIDCLYLSLFAVFIPPGYLTPPSFPI